MELEDWNLMKCVATKGRSGLAIMKRLIEHDAEDTLSRRKVYYWIKMVKLGRKDLSNIAPPGREPDEALLA
jgi:hypothetical protein